MNEQFTPGKWEMKKIRHIDDSQFIQIGPVDRWCNLCTVIDMPNGDIQYGWDEAKANANLIAAAPDMYEALKIALKQLKLYTPPHLWNERQAIPAIEAALSKANPNQ